MWQAVTAAYYKLCETKAPHRESVGASWRNMRGTGWFLVFAVSVVACLLGWRWAASASQPERSERPAAVSAGTASARGSVRAPAQSGDGTSASGHTAPDTGPGHLVALRGHTAAASGVSGQVRQFKEALRLAEAKGTEDQRGKLEEQLAELLAEEEARAEAKRRARAELNRWLVEDAGRPLELYLLLRQPEGVMGLGRPGRLLAGFFDNPRLEAAVLRDLRSSPDEKVRRLALDVVSARASRARLTEVTRLAGQDASAAVRVRAVGVLHGYQGDRRMLTRRKQIQGTLLDAAVDAEAQVRIRALVALAGAPQPTQDMAVVFQDLQANDPDLQVRTVAKQALHRWSTPSRRSE